MARYQTLVNVWDQAVDLSKLQPGQWVECGKGGERGIWCGTRKSGSHVAAWCGNIKGRKEPDQYIRNLLNYAKS